MQIKSEYSCKVTPNCHHGIFFKNINREDLAVIAANEDTNEIKKLVQSYLQKPNGKIPEISEKYIEDAIKNLPRLLKNVQYIVYETGEENYFYKKTDFKNKYYDNLFQNISDLAEGKQTMDNFDATLVKSIFGFIKLSLMNQKKEIEKYNL